MVSPPAGVTADAEPLGTSGAPSFDDVLAARGLPPLRTAAIDVLQVNVGKLCNQTCAHCHVDAGPDRREQMSQETAERVVELLRRHPIPTLDITGGAPELTRSSASSPRRARGSGDA